MVQRSGFLRTLEAQNPRPQACPAGSGRAVSAKQLADFFEYFRAFVQSRDMYFVVSNIVQPLTAASELSYSELVGPLGFRISLVL